MALIRSILLGTGCGSHAKGMLTARTPAEGESSLADGSRRHCGARLARVGEAIG